MFSLINLSGKILSAVAVVVASVVLFQLPGPVRVDTQIGFYQNGQWEVRQVLELSPAAQQAVAGGSPSVASLTDQLGKLKKAATDLKFTYNEQTRSDGWTVVTAAGVGTGFDSLSNMVFNGKAQFITGTIGTAVTAATAGPPEISLFVGNLDPSSITTAGGSTSYRITAQQINSSNADQIQLAKTAIWQNPVEINVHFIELPGAPLGAVLSNTVAVAGGQAVTQPAPQAAAVNIIRNGDFETPWAQQDGVAPEWQSYDNGHAHFGWYEELWPEAVRHGKQAQLMEIYEVEANQLDRVMAIYQTVDVAPSTTYALDLYAIMRTTADRELRNKSEFEMHWGVDPHGEGNYENVTDWQLMPLNEQNRLGSHAAFPEDIPLVYQHITGTLRTAPDAHQITLFIRGLKKFPTNVEVNFDVDQVSLTKAVSGTAVIAVKPAVSVPSEETAKLPTSGAVLSMPVSLGLVAFGGFVLVILGAAATIGLLYSHRRD